MSNNSLDNSINGRYAIGGITEVSMTRLEIWTKNEMLTDSTDIIYYVEKAYEGIHGHRKLGKVFYGDEGLWWVICQYNNIINPVTELKEGKLLLIPTIERIKSELLINTTMIQGGIPSTRESNLNGDAS